MSHSFWVGYIPGIDFDDSTHALKVLEPFLVNLGVPAGDDDIPSATTYHPSTERQAESARQPNKPVCPIVHKHGFRVNRLDFGEYGGACCPVYQARRIATNCCIGNLS